MPPELQMVAGAPVVMFRHNIDEGGGVSPKIRIPDGGFVMTLCVASVARSRSQLSFTWLVHGCLGNAYMSHVVPSRIAALRSEIESKSSREREPSCTCASAGA